MTEDFIEDDDWTISERGAQCPYCGENNHVESEDYGDTGLIDRKCCNCEKVFQYQIEFSVTFEGYKKLTTPTTSKET